MIDHPRSEPRPDMKLSGCIFVLLSQRYGGGSLLPFISMSSWRGDGPSWLVVNERRRKRIAHASSRPRKRRVSWLAPGRVRLLHSSPRDDSARFEAALVRVSVDPPS